jgi:hypothetical protein
MEHCKGRKHWIRPHDDCYSNPTREQLRQVVSKAEETLY